MVRFVSLSGQRSDEALSLCPRLQECASPSSIMVSGPIPTCLSLSRYSTTLQSQKQTYFYNIPAPSVVRYYFVIIQDLQAAFHYYYYLSKPPFIFSSGIQFPQSSTHTHSPRYSFTLHPSPPPIIIHHQLPRSHIILLIILFPIPCARNLSPPFILFYLLQRREEGEENRYTLLAH